MRVAYQAGVLVALEQEGLRFHHFDGTSGGTINLSMLLSGQSPAEICERWRSLDPRSFSAPLPWTDYVRSPHWPGLGGLGGIKDRAFPALGISAEKIREADGVTGTYNVCNFTTKTAEVVDHRQVDDDLLVAAISLPVLTPAVHRDGVAYTDAVWIRDSNVPEAVRRGSKEIWLVWCIGNTPRYQNGSFHQYVHMIEMAANGSLLADLDHLAAGPLSGELTLHVIKPSRPIPLDTDYFFGRVDAASLIGMGYRDARAYLANAQPLRPPWGPDVTAMSESRPGVVARSALDGYFRWAAGTDRTGDSGPMEVHLWMEAPAASGGFLAMEAVGDVSLPGWGPPQLIQTGTVCFGGVERLYMELNILTAWGPYRLSGSAGRGGVELTLHETWTDTVAGSGALALQRRDVARLLSTVRPSGFSSAGEGWRARLSADRVIWQAINRYFLEPYETRSQ